MRPYSSNTITDPKKFKERLAAIKTRVTFNKDEMNVGVSAVAAPVKSPSGKVEYSGALPDPPQELTLSIFPTCPN